MKRYFFKISKRFISITCLLFVFAPVNLSFKTEKKTNRNDKIKAALLKANIFLQGVQREDGAVSDSSNPLFETWETILAATVIYKAEPGTDNFAFKKAMAFLYQNENSSGLVCHNRKCKVAYCLETTAIYCKLLQLTGKNDKIKLALQQVCAMQKPSGQWDIGNPDVIGVKDFPSVTAFVLVMLQDAAVQPLYKEQAIQWLISKQTKTGHWDANYEYYGCPAYALWPVMKVLQHHKTVESQASLEKAIAYIISNQQADGSWFYNDTAYPKQTSAELQTALMLAALQNAGVKNKEVLEKGIDFLLYKQTEKGNWYGGYFPVPEKRYNKQEYIFATAMAADVFQHYLLNQ